MAHFFTNYYNLTIIGSGSWETIDLSSYIPADATGVIIKNVKTAISSTAYGIRQNGHSDTLTDIEYGQTNCVHYVAVDSNKYIQINCTSATVNTFKLLGYFKSEANWFDPYVDVTPTTLDGSWQLVSSLPGVPAGATFAILKVVSTASTVKINFRKQGSTANRYYSNFLNHHRGYLVGLNNGAFECAAAEFAAGKLKVYLIGYLTTGVAYDGLTDICPSATAVWTTKDLTTIGTPPSSNTTGVIIEYFGTQSNADVRKDGSTDDNSGNTIYSSAHFCTGISNSLKYSGYINAGASHFWLLGYLTSDTPPSAGNMNTSLPAITGAATGLTGQVATATMTLPAITCIGTGFLGWSLVKNLPIHTLNVTLGSNLELDLLMNTLVAHTEIGSQALLNLLLPTLETTVSATTFSNLEKNLLKHTLNTVIYLGTTSNLSKNLFLIDTISITDWESINSSLSANLLIETLIGNTTFVLISDTSDGGLTLTKGNCIVMNLQNMTVSEYNTANTNAVIILAPDDFGSDLFKSLHSCNINYKGGNLNVAQYFGDTVGVAQVINNDNSTYLNKRVKFGKGSKNRLLGLKITNVGGSNFTINSLALKTLISDARTKENKEV